MRLVPGRKWLLVRTYKHENDPKPRRAQIDEPLAAAIAAGHSLRDAAEIAHCSLSTVVRRLREPTFQARVVDLQAKSSDRASNLLSSAMVGAIGVLIELMQGSRSDHCRLGAARALAELNLTVVQRKEAESEIAATLADLQARLDQLDADQLADAGITPIKRGKSATAQE